LVHSDEGGAIGAFGALCIAVIKRKINWSKFKDAIKKTTEITGMVYIMLIGAFIFQYFSSTSQIPQWIGSTIAGLGISPVLVVLVFSIVYLILGCFMDGLAMMLCTIPIFFPVVQSWVSTRSGSG
jgi:TRAP-type C4-dicarboxylate transport system permease large subunit